MSNIMGTVSEQKKVENSTALMRGTILVPLGVGGTVFNLLFVCENRTPLSMGYYQNSTPIGAKLWTANTVRSLIAPLSVGASRCPPSWGIHFPSEHPSPRRECSGIAEAD